MNSAVHSDTQVTDNEHTKKSPHYICTGGCRGISDHPGNCQTDGCPLKGHELTSCDCADNLHHNFTK